ncbi:MAG TPA: DNA polymerase III subunit gamma/tau [Kofleriaceae bacterium]
MSYLVLARKYRPTTFAEVVGQEHVTRTLANAFASGRVHHAFLFCGPRGCGKTTLARIVGKALNCLDLQPGGTPCGVCAACVSIANGSAVDYQEMDGASNRGIDAIRELTEAVRYQPAVLRKKVYVIDEVHMLTTEAFNALLKTLEEPPPHVTFVLATTEPHKLPNTILSRCQRYDFKLVPASRLAQHLTNVFASEDLPIEQPAVSLLVRESGGSVRDALSLSDQIISYVGAATITEHAVAEVLGVADRTLTRGLVRALASGDAGAALAAVDAAIDRGVDEVQLARAIVRYLRDLSVLQVAPNRAELVDAADEERAELAAEAAALPRTRITLMFERMLRCCDELGKTLQPRLVLDCALIDVATVEPLVPLGDLIDRLGDLEARLSSGGSARPRAPSAPSGGSSSGGGPRPSSSSSPSSPSPSSSSSSPAPSTPRPTPAPSTSAAPSTPAPAPVVESRAPAMAAAVVESRAPAMAAPVVESRAPAMAAPVVAAPTMSAAMAASSGSSSMAAMAASSGSSSMAAPHVASAVPMAVAAAKSAPVTMEPSGPVPLAPPVASGSGPHADVPSAVATTQSSLAWTDVLAAIDGAMKMSLQFFHHARVMKWSAELVELGFPVASHSQGDLAIDARDDLRTLIRELAPAFKTVRVEVRNLSEAESGQSGQRSVLEATREQKAAERGKREAEARAHPITKHVLQTFGAQIKEIKTDV